MYDFESAPFYHVVGVNGSEQGVHIIHDKNNDYKILSKPDETLSSGDIVTWEDNDWLIVRTFGDSQVQTKGIIIKCNNVLNYYQNNTNTLHKIPCAIEASVQLYRMGYDSNRYLSEPSNTIVVRIPHNEITSQIKRNGIYQLGMQSYKIVDMSDVIERGILVLKMEFSQEQQIELPPSTPSEYSLVGADEIKVGSIQTYTAKKSVDTSASFTFIILGDVPIDKYELVVVDGQNCTIKALDYTHYIELVATDTSDITKSVSKSIKLRSIL